MNYTFLCLCVSYDLYDNMLHRMNKNGLKSMIMRKVKPWFVITRMNQKYNLGYKNDSGGDA